MESLQESKDVELDGTPSTLISSATKHFKLAKHKTITVKNMSYTVIDNGRTGPTNSTAGKEKTILKDISFYLKPGSMTLVLGAPGGGRTSLFKVLADHLQPGSHVDGEILFDGERINPQKHHQQVAYITQEDNHLPQLTVRETLWFSGECTFGKSPREEQDSRLDLLLQILGLSHVQNTVIGDQFLRGISGGQKKRVTIGLDLLKGANVLLMDEPTTGLDSVTVIELMQHIQSIAVSTGISVMCALLQPPAEVIPLFDHLLIVNEGSISYFGPMASAQSYFKDLGFEASADTNIAEFYQEVVMTPENYAIGDQSISNKSSPTSASEFAQEFKNSHLYSDAMKTIEQFSTHTHHVHKKKKSPKPEYANSFIRQAELCIWRAWKVIFRTRTTQMYSRFLPTFLIGLLFGFSFLNSDHTQEGANNRKSLLFICLVFTYYSTMISCEDLYRERRVFYEQRDVRKWYRTAPYFLAYSSTEIVLGFAQTLLLALLAYWLSDLERGEGRFVYYVLNVYLNYMAGFAILFAVSALTPTAFYPGIFVPPAQMILLVNCGFVVPASKIKGWWLWMYWISPVKWGYEGLLINEFGGGIDLTCSADELVPPLNIAQEEYQGTQICTVTKGEDVLRSYDYQTEFWFRWINFVVMLGIIFILFLCAYLALARIRHQTGSATGIHMKKKKKKTKKAGSDVVVDLPNGAPTKKGYALTFQEISYFVPNPKKSETGKKDLQLLHSVSGYVEPGTILALMGPSGAGKSTLLDVLAQRKRKGTIEGKILMNGQPLDHTFVHRAAYVMQMDILPETDTVAEAVRLSAMCRLPRTMSAQAKREFADKVLHDMHLTHHAHSIIGGLSAEQRKRVNIAMELAADPQILFLDEPTSGLDSSGARKVMKCVHEVSRRNSSCSIICTIHQPSAEIFSLFDSLLLLATGGYTVYFGPLVDKEGDNRNVQLLKYCEELGYQCSPDANPADFILSFAAAKGSTLPNRVDTVLGIHESFKKSSLALQTSPLTAPPATSCADPITTSHVWVQARETTARVMRSYLRRRAELVWQILRPIFLVVFLATLLPRIDTDQVGASLRVTLIFFSISFGSLVGFTFMPSFVADRGVYYRERDSGTYGPFAYLVANVVCSTLLNAFIVTICVFPMFWISGIDPNDRFTNFLVYGVACFVSSTSFVVLGQILATALPGSGEAAMIFSVLEDATILYGGFLIRRQAMVKGLAWLRWLSFYKYSVEATAVQLLDGAKFYCKESQLLMIPLHDGTEKEYCPIMEGDILLSGGGFDKSWKGGDFGLMIGQWLFLIFLFYITLRKVRYGD